MNAQAARERANIFRNRDNDEKLTNVLQRIEKASGQGQLSIRIDANSANAEVIKTLGSMGYSIRNVGNRVGYDVEISW